jgi:hypothetical protein
VGVLGAPTLMECMNYAHDQHYKKHEHSPVKAFVLPPVVTEYGEAMQTYLKSRHLSFDIAKANGWYPAHVRGEPRVIIRSVSNGFPGLGFWQGRSMLADSQLRYDSPKGNRSDALGLVQGETYHPVTLVVTEGPMDALAAAGIPGCDGVCTFGAKPCKVQLEHLDLLGQKYHWIVVVPDKDEPAFAGRIILGMPNNKYIGIGELHSTKDLCMLEEEQRRTVVRKIVDQWNLM